MSADYRSHIAYFKPYAKKGQNVSLHILLDGIKNGTWAKQINRLRALESGSPAFDKEKSKLSAFMLSCATNGGRLASDVTAHSGLLQIDIDRVGAEEAGNVRDRIGEDRHICAAWISPSGTGVKAIMLIPIPSDSKGHKEAFEAVEVYMLETYRVKIDAICSDVSRVCYVSYDPDLMFNAEAVPLKIADYFEITQADSRGEQKRNSSESLNTEYSVLCNSITDFGLERLFQKLVTRRFSKPHRGTRNQTMVEIASTCYCAVAPQFVAAFCEQFFTDNADAFNGYDFATYQQEVASMLAGCAERYPRRLTERERGAYAELPDETARAAFRIVHNLSKNESEAQFPPPLFHLSAQQLATRVGEIRMGAWRILKAFEKAGLIETVQKGALWKAGEKPRASVFRWMLPPKE